MTTDLLQEQVAAHLANLALARWRNNHLQRSPTAAQARWMRQMQDNYLAWLQAGGFAQPDHEPPIENSGIAPLFSAPLRDY